VRTAYTRVIEVMAAAGIAGPQASPKGLRHGFGVACIEKGIPLNLVQRWLGHAQLATTAIYADAMGEEERGIVDSDGLDLAGEIVATFLDEGLGEAGDAADRELSLDPR
jgi:hypothetical protein